MSIINCETPTSGSHPSQVRSVVQVKILTFNLHVYHPRYSN